MLVPPGTSGVRDVRRITVEERFRGIVASQDLTEVVVVYLNAGQTEVDFGEMVDGGEPSASGQSHTSTRGG